MFYFVVFIYNSLWFNNTGGAALSIVLPLGKGYPRIWTGALLERNYLILFFCKNFKTR